MQNVKRSNRSHSNKHPIQKPTAAYQVIHMDTMGKQGTKDSEGNHEYVIVIIDASIKYILLDYSKGKSQSSSLSALKHIVHLFGMPMNEWNGD